MNRANVASQRTTELLEQTVLTRTLCMRAIKKDSLKVLFGKRSGIGDEATQQKSATTLYFVLARTVWCEECHVRMWISDQLLGKDNRVETILGSVTSDMARLEEFLVKPESDILRYLPKPTK